MSKFIFQLDGVLRQRKHVEEQRQLELAAAQAELTALEGELRAMDRSVQDSTADLRNNRLVGQLDMAFLAAHRRYTLAIQRKAMVLAQKMVAVKTRADAARKALLEAAKQRKIIEKLRENRKARWDDDLARRETAALDEIGTQIGYRNIMKRFHAPEQGLDTGTAAEELP